MPRADLARLLAYIVPFTLSCNELIPKQPFCADSHAALPIARVGVTWHQDVAPIVLGRCARCHVDGGSASFALDTYAKVFAVRASVRDAVVSRQMPPWLPADCCNQFRDNYGLTSEQISTVALWVDAGAPEGDPVNAAPALPQKGGLSRVDVRVQMPVSYVPESKPYHVDDFRCFILDWPANSDGYITGLNPIPGARKIVHHLIVASISTDTAASLRKREYRDGKPGFPCEGSFGALKIQTFLGGSLQGGDFPDGIGTRVGANTAILLNVHYSLVGVSEVGDQTAIEFRLDATARPAKTLPIANPLWLIEDAMRIKAGDPDKAYAFQYDPVSITRGKRIWLRGFTPHMHALASRQQFSIVRRNGTVECMTEIPNWEFGWEQPYWFDKPVPFDDGDQLYIQCHFDNSAANQSVVNGQHEAPRDIAWGVDNQEMCAGFVSYTESM
jgi:Copper type II ascorbate-dependent monooxygenase, C-terminal domain